MLFSGQPLVLKGVNYFGFETETYAPHGIWDHNLNDMLDFIKVSYISYVGVAHFKVPKHNVPQNFKKTIFAGQQLQRDSCAVFDGDGQVRTTAFGARGGDSLRCAEDLNTIFRDNPVIMNVHCHNNPNLCGTSALRMLDIFIDRSVITIL